MELQACRLVVRARELPQQAIDLALGFLEPSLGRGALRFGLCALGGLDGNARLVLLLSLVDEVAGNERAHDNHDAPPPMSRLRKLLLALVLFEGGEGSLVLLLSRHRLDARSLLGLETGPLDLGDADCFDARGVFSGALLFDPAPLVLRADSASSASRAARSASALAFSAAADRGGLLGLLTPDSVLLKAHKLLEGEEDRAFLLFGHDAWAP